MKEGSALRVLLVDDDPDDRELGIRTLRRAFPDLRLDTSVSDLASLEAALDRADMDAIVTDYQLRWSTGLHVLESARRRGLDVAIVLFTNSGSEEVAVAAFQSGLDDYVIKKPEHYGRLPHALRNALDRREAERQRRRAEEDTQRARAELERANHIKDEFLAVISHELRTPLNAILGWAALLADGRLPPAEIPRALEIIRRNARQQAELIDDLLDMSRMSFGALKLEKRPLDLAALIHDAVDSLHAAAQARGITVSQHLGARAALVEGDRGRLHQVLVNLLSNALKFTPRGGRVEVRLERRSAVVEVTVADTGTGIAPDVLPHVFDRFRQADSSSRRRHGGLGIGLAIVKSLIEQHGGSIEARSDGVDRGATFVFRLPALRGEAHGAADEEEWNHGPHGLAGLRVLVVDDDDESRVLMERLLTDVGASVALAANAVEAERRLEEFRPQVMVSDLEMPGEDGISLIRRLRARERETQQPPLPAIALTAYSRATDRERAVNAGFQLHLAKPVEPARLTDAVARLAHAAR